jgi:hypothetical protein
MSEFVPDAVGAFVGWRAWVVHDGLLGSVTMRGASPAREPMRAACSKSSRPRRHEPPGEDCSCGIYAAKNRRHLESMSYPYYDSRATQRVIAVGEVWLWGGVVEGTQGWRAQLAYPKRLVVPHEGWRHVKGLRETCGVPVRLGNTLKTVERGW